MTAVHKPTLVDLDAANKSSLEVCPDFTPVELNLSRVPSLEKGALSRHMLPPMEPWIFNLEQVWLMPTPPTRIGQAISTFEGLPLVNAGLLDHQMKTMAFPESWQAFRLYYLGSTYLPKPHSAQEAVRVAWFDNGSWFDQFEHVNTITTANARIPVFR